MAHARYHGVRLIIFIDDILINGDNHRECLKHVSFVKTLLTNLGFIVNTEKSWFGYQFSKNATVLARPQGS